MPPDLAHVLAAVPLEVLLARPLGTLVLCALGPVLTARLLWTWLVARSPEGPPGDEGFRLAPFRSGAFLLGLLQVQGAFLLGSSALGPGFVPRSSSARSELFGALCAGLAFVAGGVGRASCAPGRAPGTVRAEALLRVRLLPWFAGPLVGAWVAGRVPVLRATPTAMTIDWHGVGLATAIVAIATAFGGLLLSVSTGALRPARRETADAAREVAAREGVRLWAVLRLPTGQASLANAAAVPWARTIVVTDHLVGLLSPSELRAVLAHESGHLSEGALVTTLRLAAAVVLMATATVGMRIADVLPHLRPFAFTAVIVAAAALFIVSTRLGRAMEERADARARALVGPDALADALIRIHENARLPWVSRRRRTHPDLYDRVVACGRTLGPRPEAPKTHLGTIAALLVAVASVAGCVFADRASTISLADVPNAGGRAAQWRLRVNPWDARAIVALGWSARQTQDLERAERLAAMSRAIGGPVPEGLELASEVLAARGECASARERFEQALAAHAARSFSAPDSRLMLGGWHLPPTLVTRCGYGTTPSGP